jgi:hypothetical protein
VIHALKALTSREESKTCKAAADHASQSWPTWHCQKRTNHHILISRHTYTCDQTHVCMRTTRTNAHTLISKHTHTHTHAITKHTCTI